MRHWPSPGGTPLSFLMLYRRELFAGSSLSVVTRRLMRSTIAGFRRLSFRASRSKGGVVTTRNDGGMGYFFLRPEASRRSSPKNVSASRASPRR